MPIAETETLTSPAATTTSATTATGLDTRAVHAGRGDLAGLGVHVPPIDLSRVLL